MATLENFLRTGQLGPIRFGMTRDEVVEVLGRPTFWADDPRSQMSGYGGLLLTFSRNGSDPHWRVAHVGLYFGPDREPLPDLVWPTDWLPTAATAEADVRDFLDRTGLTPERTFRGEADFTLFIPTGARVTLADGRLYSIQFAAPRAPMKQITVSVPTETFAALSDEARRSNRSVTALCAEWINEKAKSPT